MFTPPRQITHPDARFKLLCDAAMDLDPQPIAGNVPGDPTECAHLIALADAAAARECARIGSQLAKASPNQIVHLVTQHHARISNYLFVRGLILGDSPSQTDEEPDISIF